MKRDIDTTIISPENEVQEAFRLPRYREIPDVGLYLEQTAKYINDCLDSLGDFAITGSMISNYVKKKLIANPVKKQYNRAQVANLVFIAVAKSVLSLDRIHVLLGLAQESYDSEVAYNYFCDELEQALASIRDDVPLKKIGETDVSVEKQMLRHIVVTVAHKASLDACFDRLI